MAQTSGSRTMSQTSLPVNNSPSSDKNQQQHTRVYQACIACRKRKVRCNLGSVDNPHDPPCQRCRREGKACFFSSTRRKRKGNDAEEEDLEEQEDDYEFYNKRARVNSIDTSASTTPAKGRRTCNDAAPSYIPLTPGDAAERFEPRYQHASGSESLQAQSTDDDTSGNDAAATLRQAELYDGHDALNTLAEAAGQTRKLDRARENSRISSTIRPASIRTNINPASSVTPTRQDSEPVGNTPSASTQSESIKAACGELKPPASPEDIQQGLKAWSQSRFVRNEWFTAEEGMAYVDFYYRYLAPMTPVQTPDFQNPKNHRKLLLEEPLLAVTLLTIASRYMSLPVRGGLYRGLWIHDCLWKHLQDMITRMMWGQEHMGFAGRKSDLDMNERPASGLRSIGTIESLLLLTEWHPRSLHLPAGNFHELLSTDYADEGLLDGSADSNNTETTVESWRKPCLRSDRMCWTLLANALAIAYELGLYRHPSGQLHQQDVSPTAIQLIEDRRRNSTRKLLFIYITQTSGRLNLPTLLHDDDGDELFSQVFLDRAMIFLGNSRDDEEAEPDFVQDITLWFWFRIAELNKEANAVLYVSREHMRELITTGRYRAAMQQFEESLEQWNKDFNNCKIICPCMRPVLEIEFQHLRIIIKQLALSAIVQRCLKKTPPQMITRLGTNQPSTSMQSNATPAQDLLKFVDGDRPFIKDMVSACQSLLHAIMNDLLPNRRIKYAPVRTYYRIITSSVILLKTFACGAPQDDASRSFLMLEQALEALRTCTVDDVHIGSRIAQLLGSLSAQIRSRMVRIRVATKTPPAPRDAFPSPSSQPSTTHQSGFASGSAPNTKKINGFSSFISMNGQQQSHQQHSNGISPGLLGTKFNPYSNSISATLPTMASPKVPMLSSYFPNTNILRPQTPSFAEVAQNPLYGIRFSDYDPANPAFSIIMPPAYTAHGNHTNGNYGENSNRYGNYDASCALANGNGIDHASGYAAVHSYNPADQGLMSASTFASISIDISPTHPMNAAGLDCLYPNRGDNDWLALPIDPLVQSSGEDVSVNGYGPKVGDQDMFDIYVGERFGASNG